MSGSYLDSGLARPDTVTWPLLSGVIPQLADSHIPRHETGLRLAASLAPGDTAVLIPSDEAGRSLGGLGGTGKTQLALAVAHALWDRRALDLVVWVCPATRDAVVTAYAQAMRDTGEGPAAEPAEKAAGRFLDWLIETHRPWLVILDDLGDASVLEGLWPHGRHGRVIVTSRRPDTAVRAYRPRAVEVGTFSPREALGYLSAKLHNDPDQWIGALDLADDLGYLPIALAQAAALMADTGLDCREYRARVADRMNRLAGAPPGAYPSIVASTWSLGAEMAEQIPPAGLARPALALVAMLDPNGIPGAVLTSQAACAYLTRYRRGATVDELEARAALYNLARAGLVSIDTTSAVRTVRVHALVQATVQQNLTAAEIDEAARAAAEALLQVWPRGDAPPLFEQALRDCTARLHETAGRLLWTPDCHPLLLRAGRSLETSGLTGPAVAYWQSLLAISEAELGAGHTHTLLARDRLGAAQEAAGHPDVAIDVFQAALDERQRLLGATHPDTVAARGHLARAYREAGRAQEAVKLAERVVAESEEGRGARHPDTLAAREDLGEAYLEAGKSDQAIAAFQQALAGRERVLGPEHPETMDARGELAHAYRVAGQPDKALPLYERLVTDQDRAHGPDDPDTLAARGSLAHAYRGAGRLKDALGLYRRTLADRERVQGRDHPDTITARGNLADTYFMARKYKEAIPLYERTLADRERTQGPDHPDTIAARGNLASAYHSARRLAQAIPLYEQNLADCERVLGPDHPDTLTSRSNLAHAYHTVGRMVEAQAMFERTLADCERALGPDHPLTQTARENLAAVTRALSGAGPIPAAPGPNTSTRRECASAGGAGPERGHQRRDHLTQVPHYRVVGVREDRRAGIGVDHDDVRGAGAAGHVLDGPADPAGQVELGGDLGAGLPDLLPVRPPALAGHHAGDPDDAAEQAGQFLQRREPVRAADAPASADHHPRGGQGRSRTVPGRLGGAHPQVTLVQGGHVRVNREGAGLGHGHRRDRLGGHGQQRGRALQAGLFEQQAGPAVPDDLVGAVTVRLGGDAVRGHRQAGERAEVGHHLVAAVRGRRDHRDRAGVRGQPGESPRPGPRRVAASIPGLDQVGAGRPVGR